MNRPRLFAVAEIYAPDVQFKTAQAPPERCQQMTHESFGYHIHPVFRHAPPTAEVLYGPIREIAVLKFVIAGSCRTLHTTA